MRFLSVHLNMPLLAGSGEAWRPLQKFTFRVVFIFIPLFAVSFSFPHPLLPDPGFYTQVYFEKGSAWFGKNILGLSHHYATQLVSDSTGFYVNALFVLTVAVLASVVWSLADKRCNHCRLLYHCLRVGARYYLCTQWFTYGFSKLFKWQFYLPEPNTLYTPFGQLSPDILYWSTMGLSRTYSVLTGSIEVVAGLLLLFRRTALLGAAISLAALLNIFIVNLSFDISVKLYTLFLLLLCAVVLMPGAKGLWAAFLQRRYVPVVPQPTAPLKYRRAYIVLKVLVILLMVVDGLALYIQSGNYNDDEQPRPPLHGAYDVTLFVKEGDTVLPLITDTSCLRRVFVHRQGYFITQAMNDELKDYELRTDTTTQTLWISAPGDSVEYPLRYTVQPGFLEISGPVDGKEVFMKLKKLATESLPARSNPFHWTIDE